jgi:N-acetylmuramoyl-L-alanine amidase
VIGPALLAVAGDGLVVRDDLGGLNRSRVPKALVELGTMRNPGDARRLRRAARRERLAAALAAGIRTGSAARPRGARRPARTGG